MADSITDPDLGTGVVQLVKLVDGTTNGTSKAAVGANGLAVSGPVTDAQLRASAVPVALDATSLAALETINATVSDGGGSITVDGPLTDTQLRATPVPVSGSVTISDGSGPVTVDGTVSVSGSVGVTGPLTDVQIRATPLPVSGTVTITDGSGPVTVDGTVAVSGTVPVSGPLTDTQIRATALPVSGTVDLGATSLTALEHISIDNFPATQPVSGTVAVSNLPATQAVSGTVAISGTVPISGAVTVSDGSGPLTVDGTVALDSATITSLTTGGGLTDTQLRASAVPVALSDTTATGTITANGQSVSVAVNGRSTVGFSAAGTFAGINLKTERSSDGGATWSGTYATIYTSTFDPVFNSASTAIALVANTTVLIETAGATHVRVRATSYTSGTATISAVATAAVLSPMTALRDSSGFVPVTLNASSSALSTIVPVDSNSNSVAALNVSSRAMIYNESTWERKRGNTAASLLGNLSRTVTTASADQTNFNGRDLIVIFNCPTITGGASVTVAIDGKDSISGNYYNILTSAAITTVSTVVLRVGPSFGAAVAGLTATDRVPRTWRVNVTHANATAISYSVSANVMV